MNEVSSLKIESDTHRTIVSKLSSERAPVIIFRANDICSLGIARSIGAAGFEPLWLNYSWEKAPTWFSEKSRYGRHNLSVTNPATDPSTTTDQLVSLGRSLTRKYQQKILIVPSSDTVQSYMFSNEQYLLPYFDMYGDRTYSSFRSDITNKGKFFEIVSNKLPHLCPTTKLLNKTEKIIDQISQLTFPFIIKPACKDPAQTFYRLNNGRKAIEIYSVEELIENFYKFSKLDIPLVAQKKINFKHTEDEVPFYCFFDKNHELRIAASGIKELIQPPVYGTAIVLRLSHSPELLEHARNIGKCLKWCGPLMIEFIRDNISGQWQIIEVNTRPWLFNDFYRKNRLPFIGAAICEHFDYYNNSDLLNQILDNHPLKIPDHRSVGKNGACHVDLPRVIDYLVADNPAKKISSDDVIMILKKYERNISFAHGDANDLEPLRSSITEACNKHGLNQSNLERFVVKLVKAQCVHHCDFE